ncbi:hypothetical protein PJL69_05370 [Shimia sp. MMG029]|nr:hypothetical protein [Shimia sp. MMG029]
MTEDILLEIRQHIERTGLGPQALISRLESPPPGLNRSLVAAWLHGSLKTARKDILDFVMERWRQQPNTNMIDLTPKLIAALNAEKQRTGVGECALLRGLRPKEHGGLTSGIVRQWLTGKTKSAEKEHVDLVMERWSVLPDYNDEWLTFTKDMRTNLVSLNSKAQISWPRFFEERDDIPDDLNYAAVHAFFGGQRKSIRKAHYQYLLETLTALGDETDNAKPRYPKRRKRYGTGSQNRIGYIPLTPEMSQALKVEHDRTGITLKSFATILAASGDGINVKPSALSNWMRGNPMEVREALYHEVLSLWRSLPDKNAFWDS